MENFRFYNPVKIIFGKGAENNAGKEITRYGQNVLLVYGRNSIKQSGLYEKILYELQKAGIKVVEHPGVKSNPVLQHVKEGIEKAIKTKCEAVLAVGGGSVIDESKAIAAGVKHSGDIWNFFEGKSKITGALPIITILTLAASGSEMNAGCVITNEDTRQKFSAHSPHLFPKVSMLNPELTTSVPGDYTAYGVIDAMSHVLEGYFSTKTDNAFITDELCEGICKTLIKSMNILKNDLTNYAARANVMWSAALALNSLQRLGYKNTEFINHAIEHSLSAIYDIPHGAGLSIVIPAYMRFNLEKGNFKRIAHFGKNVLGINTTNEEKAASETVRRIKEWFSEIGSPVTLKEVNIPSGDIPDIAENAMATVKAWGMSYARRSIEEILKYSVA